LEQSDPDLRVFADRRALQQILINLLSNAIKFTDRGSVTLTVQAASEHDMKYVTFSVRDTGIGISAEDQAHLFQAFSRVFRESSKRREGTGLGLHLSRKLAHMMNGGIRVTSAPGAGSTFTLDLPSV
jgi:signal transduction histidine kinase